jgi:hypothetical protein
MARGWSRNRDETRFLRDLSLRTWRYFSDYSKPESNWLAPDNVQFDPYAEAHRSSPTNMGLQLVANFAAQEFGYLTLPEFAHSTENVLATLDRLKRWRGHFLNWYDTTTLEPLLPQYVSSVDSGNLAAALITLKQGCTALLGRHIVGSQLMPGLRDHCARIRNSIPHAGRTAPIMRQAIGLCKQLDYEPQSLFGWEGLLTEVRKMGGALADNIAWFAEHSRSRNSEPAEEAHYWAQAFNSRADAILETLTTFAPWLSGRLEIEFRLLASDPHMSALTRLLGEIPNLVGLPVHYDAIAREVRELLQDTSLIESKRQALEDLLGAIGPASARAKGLIAQFHRAEFYADRLFQEMDFSILYDSERNLMRVGMEVASGQPDQYHYDLLASEARTAVFLAIAKGDIPREAWFRLGRKLTAYQGLRTLLSWSGTMFEYLMPALFLRVFENSLLAESLESAVRIQQRYCKARGVPWGISEAAHNEKNVHEHYQYRAFGVHVMGASKMDPSDIVVAPYATMLALQVDRTGAVANLRRMADSGWLGESGFFESIDYRQNRPILIRAYMVHHQGMALAALANTLLRNVIQKMFHADPIVQATELLLQERIPVMIEEHQRPALPLEPAPLEETAIPVAQHN